MDRLWPNALREADMQLTINKKALSLATSRVQGAITERSLAQIAIKAENNTLQVAATDRVIAVYSNLECTVDQPGTVFVPARFFSDVVRELPDGDVQLATHQSHLVITASAESQFTMKIPLIEDLSWRDPPQIKSDNSANVPSEKLAYLIEQVQFCVAHESPRNYGSVGYLHKPDPDRVRLVGTDGFRLSYCEVEVSVSDLFLSGGVCLSKRALTELYRMAGEGYDQINMAISEDNTTMVASSPGYQIFIRLSAVKYPNYVGVLPKTKHEGVQVQRPQLQHVTKRVLLASDKSKALQLSFSNSSLTLSSKTMGSSEGKETIKLDDYHGPACQLAVNGKFLADVFSTTPSERLTLQFSNDEDPMVITPRNEPEACRSKHVLVPIKESEA